MQIKPLGKLTASDLRALNGGARALAGDLGCATCLPYPSTPQGTVRLSRVEGVRALPRAVSGLGDLVVVIS